MANLTFKDIRYIRAALAREVEYLDRKTGQNNNGTPPEPLSDDEWSDIGEDIIFYDKLLYWFQQWEMQSVPLQAVPKDGGVEEKKDGSN